jgi:hypothetical protein
MTGLREWFTTFTKLPAQHWPIKVIFANLLYATGIGDITIDRLIGDTWRLGYLENILFVPGLDRLAATSSPSFALQLKISRPSALVPDVL